jgi:hypothetical protein
MEQAIEDRGGEDVVAEDRAPLRDDLIGGDQEAAAFVPASDELEKERRAASFKRQVAELVDLCGAPHKSTKSAISRTAPTRPTCSSTSSPNAIAGIGR